MKSFFYLSLGLLTLALGGCLGTSNNSRTAGSMFGRKPAKALVTGADRTNKYVPYLQGKRIGMVVNQSSTIGGEPSVDRLLEMGVQVKRIFGPEHGFRGNASNGAKVGDEIDEKTGLPIISLYGEKRKPNKEDLVGLDLMIYDIQDVGVRFLYQDQYAPGRDGILRGEQYRVDDSGSA